MPSVPFEDAEIPKEDLMRFQITQQLAKDTNVTVGYDPTVGIYLKAALDFQIGDVVLEEMKEFICDLKDWNTKDDEIVNELLPKYQTQSRQPLMEVPYLRKQSLQLDRDSSLGLEKSEKFISLLMLNAVGCDCCGLKLFPLISKMMHSCSPNTFLVDKKDEFPVQIVATKPIKKGDLLTRTYITDDDLFWSLSIRKEFLFNFMHFICLCERCIILDPFDRFLCSCSGDICFNQFSLVEEKVDIIEEFECTKCHRVSDKSELPLLLAVEMENIAFRIKNKYEKQEYVNIIDGIPLMELIVKSSKKLGPRNFSTIVFMEAYVFYYFHKFNKPCQHVVKFVEQLLEYYAIVYYSVCPIAAASRTDELLEWCAIPSRHLKKLFPFYTLGDENAKNLDRWQRLIKHTS